MALQFVFPYQQAHRHALVYSAHTNRKKKNHVSSFPLPRMGHCSGLLLRERQLLVFWWEAPTTFLGQEMAYFSKKRPREKAWNSQILSSISALTVDCLCMYQENWKWRKEGEGGVSGALGTFCLCCLHTHSLTHPERWHIVMNIHIHHCSSSALFSLPQRYYLHIPPFFFFFFSQTETTSELPALLLALPSYGYRIQNLYP